MSYLEIDNTIPTANVETIRELIRNLAPIAANLSADDPESDAGWTVLNAALALRHYLQILERTTHRGESNE